MKTLSNFKKEKVDLTSSFGGTYGNGAPSLGVTVFTYSGSGEQSYNFQTGELTMSEGVEQSSYQELDEGSYY